MSKQNIQVFDFYTSKSFRKSSVSISEAIKTKIDENNTKINQLLDEISNNFSDISDAVICLVAIVRRDNNAAPKAAYVHSLVKKVSMLQKENEQLGFTLRNMHIDPIVFYDLGMEDLEKFGL